MMSDLQNLFGVRSDRLLLLEKIREKGSISAAAKAVGLSYKAAWESVERLNNLSDAPLVERVAGGRTGGGTHLTPHGEEVLRLVRAMEQEFRAFLDALGEGGERFDSFHRAYRLMHRLNLRTSARNLFHGRVSRIRRGPVESEVSLDLGGGDELVALITTTSLEPMGLEIGSGCQALVKAPWVVVTTDEGLRTSARNRLSGVVTHCITGPVNGEVVIALAGGKSVAAVVTADSVEALGLREGVRASALIKASHVILAVGE